MSNQRVEFLGILESKLSHLPNREIEKIISYYNESIEDRLEDGMTEVDAIKSLGTIDSIVINIEEEISFSDIVKDKINSGSQTTLINGDAVHKIAIDNEKVEYVFSGDYAQIHFDTDNRGVEIKKSLDNDMHLVVYENKYEYYEINENENLNIKYIEEKGLFGKKLSFFNENKQPAELYIPENKSQEIFVSSTNDDIYVNEIKLDSVILSNVNGDVKVTNSIIKNIKIDIKNGDVEVSNCISNNIIDANNKNGDIDVKNVKSDSLKTDNKNGDIEISNINSNNGIDISNRNGDIKVSTVKGNDIKIENKNAYINVTSIYSKNNIEISNDNGDIDFSNLEFFGQLDIKSSNASVVGDVVGVESDYTFDVTSRNGSAIVNQKRTDGIIGSGSKLVKINCSNGSVNVGTK